MIVCNRDNLLSKARLYNESDLKIDDINDYNYVIKHVLESWNGTRLQQKLVHTCKFQLLICCQEVNCLWFYATLESSTSARVRVRYRSYIIV